MGMGIQHILLGWDGSTGCGAPTGMPAIILVSYKSLSIKSLPVLASNVINTFTVVWR